MESGTSGLTPCLFVAGAIRRSSPCASPGNGANIIYIDWENDIVAVFRWIAGDGLNNSVERIIASLKTPTKTPDLISRRPIAGALKSKNPNPV